MANSDLDNKALSKRYQSFNTNTAVLNKDIQGVFTGKTQYRLIQFSINVPATFFVKFFDDLIYSVSNINVHTKQKFEIQKKEHLYEAYDGIETWADIYPIYKSINTDEKHFIYYIDGVYKWLLHLHGVMILDVRFKAATKKTHSIFVVHAYMQIGDAWLRNIAGLMMGLDVFENKVDAIIDRTVSKIQRLAFITSRRMYFKDRK